MVFQRKKTIHSKYLKEEIECKETFKDQDSYTKKFLEDWENCRERHPGQLLVLDSIFKDEMKYTFYRSGRKGAKTTTAIDAAWKMANLGPDRVIYLVYPSIKAGEEIVWEERRLQTCDLKENYMMDTYVEKVDEAKKMIRFMNGSFIKLIGTWTESRGRGRQPDLIIFDEFQDCDSDYVEASDSDLAPKEHARCVFMGTPPSKKNHYESWWDRVSYNPKGKCFHLTSYDNTRLPHLKEWLDNKKHELIKAQKEDVWLREYMAEFCYSSSDRILPDAKFEERDGIDQKIRLFTYADRIPILSITVHPTYFCCVLSILLHRKMLFVVDQCIFKNVWNRAFSEMYPEIREKIKIIQDYCGKKMRKIVWDESESFIDVVSGFTKCRKDIKWQDRGISLLKELMVKEKILISREVGDFGVECQNMLIEESEKDVQKNYPLVCNLSMVVNEYFSQEKILIHRESEFDKWDAFREMGIPCPPKKKNKVYFFSK